MTEYQGTWCSSLHPVIFGDVKLTLTEGTENKTPAKFTFQGRYKKGESQEVLLQVERAARQMRYDNVTFQVDSFGDIIQGTYSSSFPLVDKGRFIVAKSGISIPHLRGTDQCRLL